MSDQMDPPRRVPWTEYTLEKLQELLIAQEIAQEDRNGAFTWIWVGGVIALGGTYWHTIAPPPPHVMELQDFAGFVVGLIALIAGAALRINSGIDLRRLRRTQKTIQAGKYRL